MEHLATQTTAAERAAVSGACRWTIDAVIDRLVAEVREGMSHGYFKYTVTGGDAPGGYTQVMLEAGKTFRFLIPKAPPK